MTDPDPTPQAIADAERIAAERQQLTTTMDTLATQLGIAPGAQPPAAVADLVHRFGPATVMAARHVGYDPECLRWLALSYRFWAGQLVDWAAAGDAGAEELLAGVEDLLRGHSS